MNGFQVDIDGLRNAASAATSAGEQAKQVHLGDCATDISAALPGSRSAGKAESLATVWERRLSTWGEDTTTFGTNLTASADRYDADETAAREDFSIFGWLFP